MKLWFIATAFTLLLLCNDACALKGTWRGKLVFGQTELPLVFNFSENAEGQTECTLDSPLQGAKGIPTLVQFCTVDSIALECRTIGASFNGRISNDRISGKFAQRGMAFPLTLTLDASQEERRPQTPKPPFPYTVIDTVFTAPDGARLSATLTLPVAYKNKRIPAVVMVTGSGPQNRDEELFEHKPFAVIADYLARNGVASLRYDDRGTGKSTGDFQKATTYVFKDDAKNGIDFLRKFKGIGKVGVLGHSEGGTIAFLLGGEKQADFIISLAGMAETGKETLMKQNIRSLDKAGITGKDKENSVALLDLLFDTMAEQQRNRVITSINPDSLARANGISVPPAVMASLRVAQKARTPWFDAILTLNPRESLSKIECALLAINGDKDTQVEAETNLAVIKKLVPRAVARKMPSLNHLMQRATTGEVSEYGEIRETISPEVLAMMLDFILTLP
ncbi:MAG: alpha/beta hydrolase [Odoribacter sp.]|nr:alpha/beta hydrolase [Odoribacter sp.]